MLQVQQSGAILTINKRLNNSYYNTRWSAVFHVYGTSKGNQTISDHHGNSSAQKNYKNRCHQVNMSYYNI